MHIYIMSRQCSRSYEVCMGMGSSSRYIRSTNGHGGAQPHTILCIGSAKLSITKSTLEAARLTRALLLLT